MKNDVQMQLAPIPRYSGDFKEGPAPPVEWWECPYCRRKLRIVERWGVFCDNCESSWRMVARRSWVQTGFGDGPNPTRLQLLLTT